MGTTNLNEYEHLSSYNEYLEIYKDVLPSLDDERAKILLENSLYLSIFTTFEIFLKEIIDIYINNVAEKGLKFDKLVDKFAIEYLKNKEKQISNFFKSPESSFSNIKNLLCEDLKQQEISNYVKFEFLHKEKLNSHYPALFEQILGEKDFLDSVKLVTISKYSDTECLEHKLSRNAKDFISEYTTEIRNNIAHQNNKFSVKNVSFEECVDNFRKIITEIYNKFVSYHGLKNKDLNVKDNILDDIFQ